MEPHPFASICTHIPGIYCLSVGKDLTDPPRKNNSSSLLLRLDGRLLLARIYCSIVNRLKFKDKFFPFDTYLPFNVHAKLEFLLNQIPLPRFRDFYPLNSSFNPFLKTMVLEYLR